MKLNCDINSYLEIARLAMAMIADDLVDDLDMSDDEFLRLRDQLQEYLDGEKNT
tara:strand:+ start:203 stop:364 length:162 start_codon:yes stop_codon:yes gene_type:complete